MDIQEHWCVLHSIDLALLTNYSEYGEVFIIPYSPGPQKDSITVKLQNFFRLAILTQLLPVMESGQEELLVGGQAVMEGVMMRAPHSFSVAVRQPNGTIATFTEPVARPSERYPMLRFPVLRGLGTLGQALWLGVRALRFSAESALEIEPAADAKKASSPGGWIMAANLVFSLGFFIAFYKFLPLFLATVMERHFPVFQNHYLFNVADGVIRLTLFLAFLGAVSTWKEIRRVYQYHGAEHKTVYNFESGKPVTVENAREFSRLHPRCGTSFLLVVMFMSLLIFMLIPFTGFVQRLLSRIVLLPVVAGLSYEVIRFSARRGGMLWSQLVKPGLALQRITTANPSDDQLETAVRALDDAMTLERTQGGELVIA